MDVKTVRKKLFHAAQLQTQLNHLMGELEKDMEFENGNELFDNVFCGIDWHIHKIYYGCRVVDGKLYDSGNHLLSRDGCCMNEPLGSLPVYKWCGGELILYSHTHRSTQSSILA